MSAPNYLCIYPCGTNLQVQTLIDVFNHFADGTSTFDIVDVAACAHAGYFGLSPDVLLPRGPDTESEPVAPVRLLERPSRYNDENLRFVLEAQDDCADEWRTLTKYIEGLVLVVGAMPKDNWAGLHHAPVLLMDVKSHGFVMFDAEGNLEGDDGGPPERVAAA